MDELNRNFYWQMKCYESRSTNSIDRVTSESRIPTNAIGRSPPLRGGQLKSRSSQITPQGVSLDYEHQQPPNQFLFTDSRKVHRASSFDNRSKPALTCDGEGPNREQALQGYLSPPANLSPRVKYQKRQEIFTGQHSISIQDKRNRFGVTPSIEISFVENNSDSAQSDSEQSFESSVLNIDGRNRSNLKSSRQRKRLPLTPKEAHFVQQRRLNADRGGKSRLNDRPDFLEEYKSDLPLSGANVVERGSTTYLTRPKLQRQPKSFQEDLSEVDTSSLTVDRQKLSEFRWSSGADINKPMDDFDYFCHIANSPTGPKPSTRRNKHHPAIRTHSMRTASPDEEKLYTYAPTQEHHISGMRYPLEQGEPGSQEKTDSGPLSLTSSSHLEPQVKSRLRRANTDEEHYNHCNAVRGERRLMTATLSYAQINTVPPNLCMTPPKTVPEIPMLPQVDGGNSGLPLGVPLTEEALVADAPGLTFYQVQVLGASGVGKSSLCQQLVNLKREERKNIIGDDSDDEDEQTREAYSITVNLHNAVYTVNFIDSSAEGFEENLEIQIHDCVDAFIVVYAIDDAHSFQSARVIVQALSTQSSAGQPRSSKASEGSVSPLLSPVYTGSPIVTPSVICLVGNKADLVRGRQVSLEDGRHLASQHDAKFIEVSASLNHMIGSLLDQLISQLRDSELRGRDPRLPTTYDRRVNYAQVTGAGVTIPPPLPASVLQSKPGRSKGQTMAGTSNPFHIQLPTKRSISRFFKKTFS